MLTSAAAKDPKFTYTTDNGAQVSTLERLMPDVPFPATTIPTREEFFSLDDPKKPNVDFLKQHFKNEGKLSDEQILFLVVSGTEVLKTEPNLLALPIPINICGDIHGQFYDLLKLLEMGGNPAKNKYLFLGDYVDRGYFSIECFLYLLALKICYPENIFMLRGNHECKHLASHFTFKLECNHKYSESVFDACCEGFNALPLAAIVNNQFFCVHGGISPELNSLEDIQKINRFREPPTHGLMCDLLWSDPGEHFGDESTAQHFVHNRVRGCSYNYTFAGVCAFLEKFNLLSLVRAHEAQDAGYKIYKQTKRKFPSVITLFSAPNYLDVYNNKGAILHYDGTNFNVRQFRHSAHPYYLPNFMDVFSWSVPFVGEKVMEMLLAMLDFSSKDDNLLTSVSPEEKRKFEEESMARKSAIKQKIAAVGKMAHTFMLLREERETIMELKNALGKDVLPCGTLALGIEELRKQIRNFEDARNVDIKNEALPPDSLDIPDNISEISAPSVSPHPEMMNEEGIAQFSQPGDQEPPREQSPVIDFTETRRLKDIQIEEHEKQQHELEEKENVTEVGISAASSTEISPIEEAEDEEVIPAETFVEQNEHVSGPRRRKSKSKKKKKRRGSAASSNTATTEEGDEEESTPLVQEETKHEEVEEDVKPAVQSEESTAQVHQEESESVHEAQSDEPVNEPETKAEPTETKAASTAQESQPVKILPIAKPKNTSIASLGKIKQADFESPSTTVDVDQGALVKAKQMLTMEYEEAAKKSGGNSCCSCFSS